jgi:perosamine synthetase
MKGVRQVADEHGLRIIEDAAQTLGSKFGGQFAGTFGDAGVFSFHGTKTMTTGEGGMFVTDNDDLHDRVQFLRDHGRNKANYRNFYNTEVAYKYRMSGLQAAFGLGQIERIEELLGRKKEIFGWYEDRLRDVRGLRLNPQPAGFVNTYWMPTILLDEEYGITNRDLMTAFAEHSIDVRPFFHPLSALPAFSDTAQAAAALDRNLTAYRLSPRGTNLPSPMRLTETQADRVCTILRDILEQESS